MPVVSVSYFLGSGQVPFNNVATVGPIVWIDPFDDITDKVLFRQAYEQSVASYAATSLNTEYPTQIGGVTYILVKEGDFSEVGGGQQRWNRYYACTPPTRTEYTSRGEVFPGIVSATFRRPPLSFPTPAKITRTYYLVGALPSLTREDRVTITGALDAPLLSEVDLLPYTNPTAADYLVLVSDDATTASSFSVRAESDYLERWVGNFYAKVGTQVKAK